MKIILTDQDIDQAIIAYVEGLGMDIKGKHVEVTLTAGRGNNGNSATVEITQPTKTEAVSVPSDNSNNEESSDDGEEDGKSLFD